jgi:OOP family OmpA-OmpF porin
MSFRTVLFILALLVGVASVASAEMPTAADYRDPVAPCYMWPAVDFDGDGVFDRLDYCNNTPKGCIVDARGCQLDADGDGVCDGMDQCPDTPKSEWVDNKGCSSTQIEAILASRIKPPPPQIIERVVEKPVPMPAQVSEVQKQLMREGVVRLQNINFDLGKATLRPESVDKLDEAGSVLEKFGDLRIEVQGHTDSRGSEAYNLKLSQARAETVRDYLLQHFHLNADHYTAKGYGESQLLVSPEQGENDFVRNRRVMLKALNPEVLPREVELKQ